MFNSSEAPRYDTALKITLGEYIGIFWAVIIQVVNLVLLNRAQEKKRVSHEKPAKIHDQAIHASNVAFVSAFNSILLIGAIVAFAGAIVGFAFTRTSAFEQQGAGASPEPANSAPDPA